jgi:hypothetical protein
MVFSTQVMQKLSISHLTRDVRHIIAAYRNVEGPKCDSP